MQRNKVACFKPQRVSGTSGIKPVLLIPCIGIILSPSTKWSLKELELGVFILPCKAVELAGRVT